MTAVPLADQRARDRILHELDTNFLVEAGAGSGKTTTLVGRMLSLVESDVRVEQIAAVTFTRKAAGELSRKFRVELERELREAVRSGGKGVDRLDRALREIDRGFVGTIHAFCARLLRERSFEARIDPRFMEVSGIEEVRLQDEFWACWLDERHAADDPILRRLQEVGVEPSELRSSFRRLVELSDVKFSAEGSALPEWSALREELLELLAQARWLMPVEPIEGRRDKLQTMVGRLTFLRNTGDWRRPADFFTALETMSASKCDVTQKLWSGEKTGKSTAKELEKLFLRFVTGSAKESLTAWYAHRYAVILEFLLPLVTAFEAHRHANGRLTFQDLLILAARLLREDPHARGELGQRYRYLLVDEFQDTDPIQAEICLLLASDPACGSDWREVRPRPGALFVVGDPKQSIYRFRRADIEIYNLVRDRFVPPLGDVLQLTCNFRSRPTIGTFVDTAFERLLSPTPTPAQAAFAPFNAQREDALGCGVFRYEIRPESGTKESIGHADAKAVASWIAGRIESGSRSAGDFLVVPHRREALPFYARELERRNVPVTTTGAGLTIELELRELLVLLEALADPGNSLWTLAALTGLFFGLDPEELWRHRLAGHRLSFERFRFDLGSRVDAALAKLREWSDLCRAWPLDGALARIVGEIGLLPLAVAGENAESRAGSIVHALELVGSAASRGETDLRSAIEVIEAVRDSPDVEATLRPGRGDAVRLMNLHKAKGLEAPVVILPYPTGVYNPPPTHRVERLGREAVGWCVFEGQNHRMLGRPADWEVHEAEERRFAAAERVRLLYVATTRARDELVVAECPEHPEKSPWLELSDELRDFATLIDMPVRERAPRERPALSATEIEARVAQVASKREAASRPAYELGAVTDPAEGDGRGEGELVFRGAEGKGREWGTLVHRALAAMGRGRSGEALRRYCRALLLGEGREQDAAGEPAELEELMRLLAAVWTSPAWGALAGARGQRWELSVARLEPAPGGPPRLVTGVVDAVGIGGDGQAWRIVDWKTDVMEGPDWVARERHYEQQVAKYGEVLAALAGVRVEGSVERVR